MLQTISTEHESSLIYAQTIQHGLLPKTRHFEKFFKDYFVVYKPQDKIGGDFYWLTSKNDTIFFALADCTGHGVPGAFLSMVGSTLLNEIINHKKLADPALIIKEAYFLCLWVIATLMQRFCVLTRQSIVS